MLSCRDIEELLSISWERTPSLSYVGQRRENPPDGSLNPGYATLRLTMPSPSIWLPPLIAHQRWLPDLQKPTQTGHLAQACGGCRGEGPLSGGPCSCHEGQGLASCGHCYKGEVETLGAGFVAVIRGGACKATNNGDFIVRIKRWCCLYLAMKEDTCTVSGR